ncbi:HTH-type transcriptional repressor ComR [compost metagenome]
MDEALDKVIPLFCARGFHGASINDIAEAMQLTVGSIYKAFKDKRGVFLAAIDRQLSLRQGALRNAIAAASSGRDKLRAALMFYVGVSNTGDDMQGCLIVSTTVELATFDDEIANRARDSYKRREVILAELLKLGEADGSIAAASNNAATARLMLCLMQGLIVIGKSGRTRKELVAVVEASMKILD